MADRLHKVMAHAGVASRRASEDLIAQGRVTVNGRTARLGDTAEPSDDIRVDGERVNVDVDLVHVMLNKPMGVVSTADDPEGRTTVTDLVTLPQRLYPVGRLDQDSEGLILLTNDGELTNRLLHPRYEVPKTYVALVRGTVKEATVARLQDGIELDDGMAAATDVEVLETQRDRTLVQLTLTEGRKREVRRMLEAVRHPVQRLARVAFAGIELGDMAQGKWRFLTQQEIGRLHAAVEGRSGAGDDARHDSAERRRRQDAQRRRPHGR